ncbi:hypothetical protein GCM10028796_34660 [Ramlibacter monticola]
MVFRVDHDHVLDAGQLAGIAGGTLRAGGQQGAGDKGEHDMAARKGATGHGSSSSHEEGRRLAGFADRRAAPGRRRGKTRGRIVENTGP